MSDEPVADEEGVVEDSAGGCEMMQGEPTEKLEVPQTTAQQVLAFVGGI